MSCDVVIGTRAIIVEHIIQSSQSDTGPAELEGPEGLWLPESFRIEKKWPPNVFRVVSFSGSSVVL